MLPLEQVKTVLETHQVVIFKSPTGSGKSSLIPSYFENQDSLVGCSQPRRIAAYSLSDYVGRVLHQNPEYARCWTRDEKQKITKDTRVVYMTEGVATIKILLQKSPSLPPLDFLFEEDEVAVEEEREETGKFLDGFSHFMVDEAHERHVSTDLLLALLGQHAVQTPHFKIIVCSATLDPEVFAAYFREKFSLRVGIVEKSLTQHPVTFEYQPPVENKVQCIVKTILPQVWSTLVEKRANVLVFAPGRREVDALRLEMVSMLPSTPFAQAACVSLHGGLSLQQQHRAMHFEHPFPKIFFSTNIAESSVTVPRVYTVVDLGLEKRPFFDPDLRIVSLYAQECSQSSCAQRAGRAGREMPGKVFRLFSQASMLTRPVHPEPEIKTTCLSSLILSLKALGNVSDIVWMEKFSEDTWKHEMSRLEKLGAVNEAKGITPKGSKMVKLSVEPGLSAFLINTFDNTRDHLIRRYAMYLSAMLAVVEQPFKTFQIPKEFKDKTVELLGTQACFSDHALYICLLNEFLNENGEWCKARNLVPFQMHEAQKMFSILERQLFKMYPFEMHDTQEQQKWTVMMRRFFIPCFSDQVAQMEMPVFAGGPKRKLDDIRSETVYKFGTQRGTCHHFSWCKEVASGLVFFHRAQKNGSQKLSFSVVSPLKK
jgi:ATP-dependent helicase HrpA